jgi:hypothetical protein
MFDRAYRLLRRELAIAKKLARIRQRTKLPAQPSGDILIDSTVDVTVGPGHPPHIRFSQNATHASESSLIQSGFETDLRKGAGS